MASLIEIAGLWGHHREILIGVDVWGGPGWRVYWRSCMEATVGVIDVTSLRLMVGVH